ncbi:MAG: T9SS type A sorting domain-containing protein [Bacteroidota bacterium]
MKKIICLLSIFFLGNYMLYAADEDSLVHHSDTILTVAPSFLMHTGAAGEINELPQAIVFPNPIQVSMIQIKFDKYVSDGLAIIYITNLNGEIVYNGQIMVNNSSAYLDLQDKHLSRGYYNITLIRGVEKVSGKFLVDE